MARRLVLGGWAKLAIGVGIGALLGGSVVSADSTSPTVHGCVVTQDGSLHVADPSGACGPGMTPLDWSVAGPSGPPGPAGLAGPTGHSGPRGVAANVQVTRLTTIEQTDTQRILSKLGAVLKRVNAIDARTKTTEAGVAGLAGLDAKVSTIESRAKDLQFDFVHHVFPSLGGLCDNLRFFMQRNKIVQVDCTP